MNYQIRKTAQGLMLYRSEEVKPKTGFLEPSYQLNRRLEFYEASFKPICPIHKEHEEGFNTLALECWKYKDGLTIEKALEQGIEIPSERVGFIKDCKSECEKSLTKKCICPDKYATLLPEKKEEESQEEMWREALKDIQIWFGNKNDNRSLKELSNDFTQKFKITRI